MENPREGGPGEPSIPTAAPETSGETLTSPTQAASPLVASPLAANTVAPTSASVTAEDIVIVSLNRFGVKFRSIAHEYTFVG
jgi:hypothetical protein